MASLGSDYYEKASVVKGHHVYKAVWTPFLGEELSVQPEDHNDHDEHAIAVTRDGYVDIAPRPPPDPAFNRDPAFIHALVRLYPAFIRGQAFIRRRHLIEEIRYVYIRIYVQTWRHCRSHQRLASFTSRSDWSTKQ